MPATHFGSGILTFHTGYLFRSDPGFNLWVQGPVNDPKDGIAALTGVIETDWSPYSFTMNWKFTRADHTVRFEVGDPFCHLFPVQRELVGSIEPELRELSSDPETEAQHRQWSGSRQTFNLELLESESEARKEKWQKNYYRGAKPDGLDSGVDHQTKLRLMPFADKLAKKDQDPS